jgi:hypothetical protein
MMNPLNESFHNCVFTIDSQKINRWPENLFELKALFGEYILNRFSETNNLKSLTNSALMENQTTTTTTTTKSSNIY